MNDLIHGVVTDVYPHTKPHTLVVIKCDEDADCNGRWAACKADWPNGIRVNDRVQAQREDQFVYPEVIVTVPKRSMRCKWAWHDSHDLEIYIGCYDTVSPGADRYDSYVDDRVAAWIKRVTFHAHTTDLDLTVKAWVSLYPETEFVFWSDEHRAWMDFATQQRSG